MSFDQEPDAPIHGECAEEIAKLRATNVRLLSNIKGLYANLVHRAGAQPQWLKDFLNDYFRPIEADVLKDLECVHAVLDDQLMRHLLDSRQPIERNSLLKKLADLRDRFGVDR